MHGWRLLALTLLVHTFSTASAAPGDCDTKGDGNRDCRIAFDDFQNFVSCMSGPGVGAHPVCACYDADIDDVVDMLDFAAFQTAFTGDALIPGCDLTPSAYEPGPRSIPPSINGLEVTAPTRVGPVKWMAPESLRDVYLFSGEAHASAVDLHIPGRGIDFVWARKYRSRVGPDTPQGVGWDHGYNVRVESSGGDLLLHDGNTRVDRYHAVQGPQGVTWCAAEFFREINQEADGSFTCRLAGRGAWRFHPLDASPREGKLIEIVDTNGNAMTFTYDISGRLTTITDTLNRPITVGYDLSGRISSVTDFAGRQVQYDYYDVADPNGAPGDLKSVTTPAVTGTPNGNDFPSGKTTTYTYSRGFADEALNHNLLSVTDPRGQTFRVNTYAATLDPNDPDYDRVVRMSLGEPNKVYDFVYEAETPTAANAYAVSRAIVNDRNGHVDEYFYDKFNRCVIVREFTGQAAANQPTSGVANRPTGKLRQTDPNVYETRLAYNAHALTTRVIDPEQNVTEYIYESDIDLRVGPRAAGNLVACRYDPGPRGGDQAEIIVEYEYDPIVNFDTNKVTREIDARGAITAHEYDSAGNRTRTTHRIPGIVEDFEYNGFGQLTAHILPDNGSGHRRRDERTYYNAGPQTGYLQSEIVDAPGLALTTTYEYDAVGNVVRTVDPRGADTLRIVNQLNQVVRVLSRPTDPNNPIRYETDTYYDENDNIVRIDVQNRDESGAIQPNTHFTTLHEYDILDRCVRTTEEVAPGQNIVTEYEYDAESNRTLIRSGEATAGRQPTNTVTTLYDERDLVFQEIRAAGDPLQSTTQLDYDGNRNPVRRAQGLENNPRITTATYDGYDRAATLIDSIGNESSRHYDENSNIICTRVDGELLDVPGGAANVRLFETTHIYDAMDRLTQTDAGFFDPVTQSPIGDGAATTVHVYTDNSQILSVTDDNSNVLTYEYDSANRQSSRTDAKGNSSAYTYDENSNVVRVTQTDISDLGLPDEVFITDSVYDGLDRLISETDSSGNVRTHAYDSRDNRVVGVDALGTETRNVFDGLNREVTRIIDLDGDGADGDAADLVMSQSWDDNSRPFLQIDDNGNGTVTSYDPLNRPAVRTMADGTTESFSYDVRDNVVNRVQPNGTSVTSAYDALDRLLSNTIVVGPGVSNDTTLETYTYDGLSRRVSAADDDSLVEFGYDSLSNVVAETLQGDVTIVTHDGVGNPLSCVYPSGRTLTYTYDSLNRLSTIEQGPTTVASYLYVGASRIALQQYANGARGVYQYDGVQGVPNPANDAGVRQVVGITHTAGPTVLDARTFRWDAMFNKTERRDTRQAGPRLAHIYRYDAAYRLTSGTQENQQGTPLRILNYNLDGVGNRVSVTGFGGVVGAYVLDPNMPPSDFQVNQYTTTPRDARAYDDNGNLTTTVSGPRQVDFAYDAYDRLVSLTDQLSGDTASYAYDALGRRIGKSLNTGCCEVRYRYVGERVIEEVDPNGVTLASYVRGTRATEIVCVETNGQTVYHHADDVGNVVALTDANGVVFERYEYDDYGAPRITDAAGSPRASSIVGNPYMFRGQRYDRETGWYLSGSRYFDPTTGRYVIRAASGGWDENGLHGNAFSFADGNPWSAAPGRGRGDHHGHVTVLKARGPGGPPHCPGCGAMLCRCTTATRAAAETCRRHGHVTVLKARGGPPHCPGCGAMLCRCTNATRSAAPRHHGHVTVLKARGPGGPPHCPGCGAMLCRCTSAARSAAPPHHGHVTVLKARGPGGPPHCPGCGAMLCRCTGSTRSAAADWHGHVTVLKARGVGGAKVCVCGNKKCDGKCDDWETPRGIACPHVTILKAPIRAAGPPHCPGCGALLCRCTSLNAAAADGATFFSGSGNTRACGCASCGKCSHGNSMSSCPEEHLPMLPAANNIPSR